MARKSVALIVAITAALAVAVTLPAGAGAAGGKKTLRVCDHGCKYSKIQRAVKAVKTKDLKASRTTIKVKPGTYFEAVEVFGHTYDGLSIEGTGDEPSDVLLQGTGGQQGTPEKARHGASLPQNGIEGRNVSGLKIRNMQADNYATNGFFIHADPGNQCVGFVMEDLIASWNRSYGMFAKHCKGGKIVDTVGYGHGDSAIYIGETPPQNNDPKWTQIARNDAYENVLGYSGTNSKYVDIHDNRFYNNGIGVVPNTLDSELFEPAATGIIEDNEIFWNNFNHYMPDSPVDTVQTGGEGTFWYPTGVGIAMYGADGWITQDNDIFGHFMWGVASFSDPFNEGDDAINQNNQFLDNHMGRTGTDVNTVDFWNDGSGSGNCWNGNLAGNPEVTGDVTFGIHPESTHDQSFLYPSCPAPDPPDAGTGTSTGDGAQLGELVGFVTVFPPCNQQDFWTEHSHPAIEGVEPLEIGGTPCPDPTR
jgi:hypothetical protein